MKKLIGYLLAHLCFYIGDGFSRLCHIKTNSKFLFDRTHLLTKIGGFFFDQYQNFMHYSSQIQDWSGNKSPWRKPTQKEKDTILG